MKNAMGLTMRHGRILVVLIWGTLSLMPRAHFADEPKQGSSAPAVDYVRDVKPLLAKHCAACHGAEKQKAGLRLDTSATAITGGDSGAAVIPGKSADSLLIQALTGAEGVSQMPPKGNAPLSAQEIALLKVWIDQGAKAPTDEASQTVAKRSNHWSFQPVNRPTVPEVRNRAWVRNPLDAFVLARLEKDSLSPAPEADRATLIRRLSLDLLGLPPSPEEVDQFVNDAKPQAYEELVDRLLASPHYGERWGRHWLDLARYADSNGFTRDFARSIWKYRDWVIDAVNRDLPFDQFTIEQIAGDMLDKDEGIRRKDEKAHTPDSSFLLNPSSLSRLVATGFHRNTLFNEEGGTDPEQFRIESVVDRVNTTSTVFLGLTIGCAQCHDHKYDPISQREYYRLFAFLNNADEPKLDVPTPEQFASGAVAKRDEIRRQVTKLEEEFKSQADEFHATVTAWEQSLSEDEKKKLPFDVLNAVSLSPEMRTEQHKKDLVAYFKKLDVARQKFPVLEQINKLQKDEPQFITTLVMQERTEPRDTHIHIRGDFLRKGAKVEPAVPEVLPPLVVEGRPANRLDLARWLVDSRNPLTPRVTVNRIWQKYFGRGLVETENDFGTQGTPPTHPELLDWLASEFVGGPLRESGVGGQDSRNKGDPSAIRNSQSEIAPEPRHSTPESSAWSLKHIHRLIVTSATYRQSSRYRTELAEIDPDNKLYARQSRLRLDAEIIRDAALAASGLLTRTIGGPSVFPPQPDGVFDFTQDKKPWIPAIGPDRYRRALYTHLWRSSPYPAMTVFDFPDANVACTRRSRSNTPLQSLTLANDQTFVEFAQGLALRVLKEAATNDTDRLRHVFRLCFSRDPKPAENQRLVALLKQQKAEFATNLKEAEQLTPHLLPIKTDITEFAAWTALARVLLNLDEFITRE